jgi:hypothetical protein
MMSFLLLLSTRALACTLTALRRDTPAARTPLRMLDAESCMVADWVTGMRACAGAAAESGGHRAPSGS